MLASGTVLQNRYQIIRLIGQGGFGAVYEARDLRLGQVVALKENTGGNARQFQQEALILANLRHANLPRVSDHFVEPDGAQYLVMDFVKGEDLDSILRRQGALAETQVLTWFDQILRAVTYMHSRGVIHRDIKPANIKITPTGEAILVDFGIAKVYQPGQPTASGARAMGSPSFAAPEQYRGGTDQRSDIYSLGATMYAMLTGREPPGADALERRTATLTPPRELNPSLSPKSEQAVLRAMAIQANQRFQSVDEMHHALKEASITQTVPVPSRANRNLVPIVIAAISLTLSVIGGFMWWSNSSPKVPARVVINTLTPVPSTSVPQVQPTAIVATIPVPPAATLQPTDTLVPPTSPGSANPTVVSPPLPSKGLVAGQVRWNGDPIGGMSIVLIKGDCRGDPIANVVTNSEGYYSFDGVEPGQYTIGENGFTWDHILFKEQKNRLFRESCLPWPFTLKAGETVTQNRDVLKIDLVVLAPIANAVTGQTPTFSWNPYPEASYYVVSLFREQPSYEQAFYEERTTQTALDSPKTLDKNSAYDGWIIAYNAKGTGMAEGLIPYFTVPGK